MSINIVETRLDGKSFSLDIADNDTVHDVKIKIQAKKSIPPDMQHLIWKGMQLEDGRKLWSYDDIKLESCLFLVQRINEVKQVFVISAQDETPILLALPLTVTDAYAMAQIENKERIPVDNLKLLCKDDNLLCFTETFMSIVVMVAAPGIVGMMVGIPYTFDVAATDTIEFVKTMIKDQFAVPPERQRLIFEGKQLEKNTIVADYKIKNGSVMHLLFNSCRTVQIFVQTLPPGKPIIFEADYFMPLDWIMAKIEREARIPRDQLVLTYQSDYLRVVVCQKPETNSS